MRRSRVKRGRAALIPWLAGMLLAFAASPSLADGGIPGSLAILLPADQPGHIGLATTFGLILSEDAGATWLWTCEQGATTAMANVYAVGPAAIASAGVGDRFYALSPLKGLAISDDQSCSWRAAGGALAGILVSDFFVDPNDPAHVLAAAVPVSDGALSPPSVFVSTDGGATFGGSPLFTAPAGAAIVGIEIARGSPSVIYVAYYVDTAASRDPVLVRSTDGGASWKSIDLAAPLGPAMVRILAVDPGDSALVYLRVIGPDVDSIAVTRDGGATFATPLKFPAGAVSAFARLNSGTVLVAALVSFTGDGGGTQGVAYRSTDGAMTFQPWTLPGPPHLVGLAERVENGHARLYLSAKNYSDGWALASSDDEGATITKLLTYDQVKGTKACVQQTCAQTCQMVEQQAVWDQSVCTGSGGGAAGGSTGGGGSGCGCGVAPTFTAAGDALLAALAALLCVTRRVRERRRFLDGDRLDRPRTAV